MLLQSHWENFHYFNTIYKICLLLCNMNMKQDQILSELPFILITYGAFQMCSQSLTALFSHKYQWQLFT